MFSIKLLHLLHLCDPGLPVGGFSHSAGLETYVQESLITNKIQAEEFATRQLSQNIYYTDAALVSLAYTAAENDDMKALLELDDICTAVKFPFEMRQASHKLGVRLLKIFQQKEFSLVNNYRLNISCKIATGHYSIAFGLIAHALQIEKSEALTGFYYNAASGFVTNAVKLIPLGQQDGQELLMSLFPLIRNLVQQSLLPEKEMIGFCCAGFDIRSMQHEQLYSRLYMS